MTARRSFFRPGSESLSALPASRHCSISQRRPAGVTRPSLMPLAASTCETAPTVPDEPSASRQWRGANGSSASSSSAPAAICASRKPRSLKRPSGKYFIDRLTLPTRNDSAWRGRVPRPRIISVERPPMSMTRRGTVDGCSRATPAKMRRASSRPETISTGWPRTVCARSRKASRFLRFAQRLRRHRAHLVRREAVESAREAGQAVEAARRCFFVEEAGGVEAGAEANGFLEVVDAAIAAALDLADLEPEAVRAHVDRRELAGPARLGAARGRRRLHAGIVAAAPRAPTDANLPRMPLPLPAPRHAAIRSRPCSCVDDGTRHRRRLRRRDAAGRHAHDAAELRRGRGARRLAALPRLDARERRRMSGVRAAWRATPPRRAAA